MKAFIYNYQHYLKMEVAMDEMKSALERAMERADSLGEASDEDRRKWKYTPEGEKLAAEYLDNNKDIITELNKYSDEERPYIIEGAQQILIRNIDLPRNDITKTKNKKAMEAIKEMKRDRAAIENVYTKIDRIFNHYEQEGAQQRNQAYEDVKRAVEAKILQAMQQQGMQASMKIDVEKQPQFHQEWRRVLSQLDAQYINLLDEYKQEIQDIS